MPNIMNSDGFIDEAIWASTVSSMPVNKDAQFQNAISNAICSQAILGSGTARSCTVSVSSYTAANTADSTQANDLINRAIQRLINLGYTASLSGTTLTINWP